MLFFNCFPRFIQLGSKANQAFIDQDNMQREKLIEQNVRLIHIH